MNFGYMNSLLLRKCNRKKWLTEKKKGIGPAFLMQIAHGWCVWFALWVRECDSFFVLICAVTAGNILVRREYGNKPVTWILCFCENITGKSDRKEGKARFPAWNGASGCGKWNAIELCCRLWVWQCGILFFPNSDVSSGKHSQKNKVQPCPDKQTVTQIPNFSRDVTEKSNHKAVKKHSPRILCAELCTAAYVSIPCGGFQRRVVLKSCWLHKFSVDLFLTNAHEWRAKKCGQIMPRTAKMPQRPFFIPNSDISLGKPVENFFLRARHKAVPASKRLHRFQISAEM